MLGNRDHVFRPSSAGCIGGSHALRQHLAGLSPGSVCFRVLRRIDVSLENRARLQGRGRADHCGPMSAVARVR